MSGNIVPAPNHGANPNKMWSRLPQKIQKKYIKTKKSNGFFGGPFHQICENW